MSKGLRDKVVAITGGGGGIGTSASRIFCEEGARVAIIDLTTEIGEKAAEKIRGQVPSADVRVFAADVGIESEAERVVREIVSAFGGLDVLVNNVAIRRYEALADAPWETWDAIVRINLLSYVSMSRAALPHLRKSGRGSIVNIGTCYAHYGRKGMGAYDATKAAVISVTRTLAWEEGEHGVRVNAISPGYTKTDFHVNRLGSEQIEAIVPPCVLKRWASPDELANPIVWLASDASSYVTGTTLMVDGGLPT